MAVGWVEVEEPLELVVPELVGVLGDEDDDDEELLPEPLEDDEEPEPCDDDDEPDPGDEEAGGGVVPASGSVYCAPAAEPPASAVPALASAMQATIDKPARAETKRRIPGY